MQALTDPEARIIAAHFMIAANWADCPEGTKPRVTKSALLNAEKLARAFVQRVGLAVFRAALEAYENEGLHPDCNGSACAAFGHDLYLTMAGHGVGFWDRKALEGYANDVTTQTLGDHLTEICKFTHPHGIHSLEFYRGWVYFRGE